MQSSLDIFPLLNTVATTLISFNQTILSYLILSLDSLFNFQSFHHPVKGRLIFYCLFTTYLSYLFTVCIFSYLFSYSGESRTSLVSNSQRCPAEDHPSARLRHLRCFTLLYSILHHPSARLRHLRCFTLLYSILHHPSARLRHLRCFASLYSILHHPSARLRHLRCFTLLYFLYSTLLYSTLLYSALLYFSLFHSTLLYSNLLHSNGVVCCILCFDVFYSACTVWP